MGKAKVKGKHRLDKYYWLAKEHGYRSRSTYKIIQIDSQFKLFSSAHGVLDLCAAPGGWMQAAVERVPVGSLVVGIDLVPILPVRGAVSIQSDITKPDCRAAIKRVMYERGSRAFDLVLHDGSPNVGGAWTQEAVTQNALVIESVKLATQFLAPKGTFVSKVFRSQDYNAVLYCLRQLFEKVEVTKPVASRASSAEIYVVGLRYKAPAKIDPRLLDVKHLFQGAMEPRKVLDVLRATKQKRHRDGYEDGETISKKVCAAADFVWSDAPLEILGSVTSITFGDPTCLPIKDHALTTEEVKALCDDLRVLGKQDFKHLLKWRMNIRRSLSPKQKATSTSTDDGKENKDDEDDRILNEMEDLTYAMEHKKKKAKKVLARKQAKEKARKKTGMQVDVMQDGYTDHELFSLSSIKGKKDLVAVEYDDENGQLGESENEETRQETVEHSNSDLDSDEERQRYDEKLEGFLDEAYERFAAKRVGSTKLRKRARQMYSKDDQLTEGEDGENVVQYDDDSDKDMGDDEANPLMVPLNEEQMPTQEEIADKWFSQDIFAEAVKDGDFEDDQSDDEIQVVKKEENVAKKKAERSKATVREENFEIVPAPATDESDSSDDSSEEGDDDVETKAEILAYAKKMLRKKQRESMLDDAYNRYMFDDVGGLPRWFAEDEKKHSQPIKPVTKEEVAAMKAQFKEIDARPAKKVAQAKARKKRVAMRKLEKVRKKANTISDQNDISDKSKRKMIDQLYKKATPKRPQKEYVVAKKGVQVRTGKGKVLVDRRMKKDTRSQAKAKAKSKGKSKFKGKGGGGGGKNANNAKGKNQRGGGGRKTSMHA